MDEFKERCFRDKFESFRGRLKEIKQLEREINKLVRKRENLPIVKDKVTSSQKEWPYIKVHISVDAYDPLQASTIDRLIWKKQRIIDAYQAEIIEVETYIDNIEDTYTRQAFRLVFIEGKTQTAAGRELGFTQSMVSRLLKAEFSKHS